MRLLPLLVAALAALSLLAPLVAAHGIDPVPDDSWQILLQDRTDDCGPEAGPGQDCHGADALVGLALKEVWDGSQDQLVFRFYLDKGTTPPFVDTLTLNTPGGAKTLALQSNDDKTFTAASGFDSVSGTTHVSTGTRFIVEGTVSPAHLGVNVGDALTNYHVESKSNGNAGDEMPGGCHNTVGDCTASNSGEYVYGGGSGSYTVRGPSYYVTLTGPQGTQTATVGQDLPTPIQLTLANGFHHLSQSVTLGIGGADGVTAGFHSGDPSGAQYQPQLTLPLDGDTSTVLHLNLHGDRAGASGTLTITATTDKGGLTTLQVPYTVQDASASSGSSDTSSSQPATDSGSTSKHSPAPAAALVGLVLLGAALLRRRA